MVRNTMGGKKAKKMKNHGPILKSTIYPDDEQLYAIVEKFNSHSSILIHYMEKDKDTDKYFVNQGIGILRGKLIKRIKKVSKGDILIVSKRNFETEKNNKMIRLDILHKYRDYEKNKILIWLPEELKNCIVFESTYINNENNELNDGEDNDIDEDIFDRNIFKQDDKNKKTKTKNNIITNNYLPDDLMNISSSDDSSVEENNDNNYNNDNYNNSKYNIDYIDK